MLTVSQYNQNFMANNPQYGAQPKNLQSTSPMGAKAVQPQAIPPKPSLMDQNQNQSNQTDISNPGLLSRLVNTASQEDPGVQAARSELERYQNAYANANAGVNMGGQDFGYTQGIEQAMGNQYQQGLASRQTALSSAITEQGQRLGSLGSAVSATQPSSQFGILTNPQSGQPITKGSLSGLAFQGGQINAAGALGGQTVQNKTDLDSARSATQQFVQSLKATPNFNPSDLTYGNALSKLINNAFSDPNLPGLQAQFNTIMYYYGNILGGAANVQSLVAQAKPTSMQSLLSYLDNLASSRLTSQTNIGQGGGVGAPISLPHTAPAPTTYSGITSGGNTYTITGP